MTTWTAMSPGRELKVRLGTYLRRVRAGRTPLVTDRGQPVAELRPVPAEAGRDAVLARLEAAGAVARPATKRLPAFGPVTRAARKQRTTINEVIIDALRKHLEVPVRRAPGPTEFKGAAR